FGPTTGPPLTVVRLQLADGGKVARNRPQQAPDAGQFVWSGIPVLGGRALYKLSPYEDQATTAVEFLDLATGSVERLDVDLAIPRDIQFAPREWGASPDGARLYVLSPLSGELAIVDLVQRRVLQKVSLGIPAPTPAAASILTDLWTNVRGALMGSAAQAKVPFSERLEVSPDGTRLYGVAARPNRTGVRGDGVWAIDTLQWRVAAHWLGGSEPFTLQLSPDGRRLYALDAQTGQSSGVLHVLDTSSGVQLATMDGPGNGQMFSVAGLFRERYGHVARPLEVPAALNPAPVAGIVLSASPVTVLAGDPLGIEVRFVDPITGRTLTPDQSDVLFAPPARVFAVISQAADPNQGLTVELDPVEYGVYRGNASAPSPTNWSRGSFTLQSVAEWPDGLRRRTLIQDALVVQPAFAGSDGRRYALRVTSEPTQPALDQPAQVAIDVVDAETRAALPDGVSVFGGLPAFVDATFYADRTGGVTIRRLDSVRPGAYAGSVNFFSPGPWRVLVSLGPPVSDTFAAGTLTVDGTHAISFYEHPRS
ncbi:MAG: lactonase family protein, partial [Chloroflexota bacterium]|nr:lactonase family protein [Chloroflexota bacterium]